jgi:tetratricopeptide (TPR) repeat protein
VFQRLGRTKEACGYYRQAVAAKPDFAAALLNLGHALMALGEHEQAQASWQDAARLDQRIAAEFLG